MRVLKYLLLDFIRVLFFIIFSMALYESLRRLMFDTGAIVLLHGFMTLLCFIMMWVTGVMLAWMLSEEYKDDLFS